MIYGGGDHKLGSLLEPVRAKPQPKVRRSEHESWKGWTASRSCLLPSRSRAEGDVLKGLDGRPIRLQGKRHAALNYLLQSAGAIICKQWVLRTHELLQEAGIDYYPLAFVHDEQQLSVRADQAQMAADITTMAMKDVEHQLNSDVLDSEFQIGANWGDCH